MSKAGIEEETLVSVDRLTGAQLVKMIQNGAANLYQNADFVDSLNVFPVPDGDTGTNMNLTMTSGAKEAGKSTSDTVSEVANVFARG